jgi:hypothetical protein
LREDVEGASLLTFSVQFRIWFFDKLGKLGQLPESTRREAGKLKEEARQKMKRPVDETASPTA